MGGASTLPGVGTAMEIADTANQIHNAYQEIQVHYSKGFTKLHLHGYLLVRSREF